MTPSLESITLKHGGHKSVEDGLCLIEAVAWFAGEPHSDRPACCDVALGAYGRALNDRMRTDGERAKLIPLIPLLVGTKGSNDLSRRRAYLLVDRYLRLDTPAYFRELPGKPRRDIAEQFERLAPVVDVASARAARVLARVLARELQAELRKALSPADADACAAAYAYACAAADACAAAYASASAYAAAYASASAYASADATASASADAYASADASASAYASADATASASADATAGEWTALRDRVLDRAVESFRAAIALTEAT